MYVCLSVCLFSCLSVCQEVNRKDHDSVTCSNPNVIVHDCKFKVDGITKYLDSNYFEFDHTFTEDDSTDDVYKYCVSGLLPFLLSVGSSSASVSAAAGRRATVFAYGQTGSGKTHTMVGIQALLAKDLFAMIAAGAGAGAGAGAVLAGIEVFVSFFEIYGGRCQVHTHIPTTFLPSHSFLPAFLPACLSTNVQSYSRTCM